MHHENAGMPLARCRLLLIRTRHHQTTLSATPLLGFFAFFDLFFDFFVVAACCSASSSVFDGGDVPRGAATSLRGATGCKTSSTSPVTHTCIAHVSQTILQKEQEAGVCLPSIAFV